MREAVARAGDAVTAYAARRRIMRRALKKHGRLDESRLAVDSAGWTNIPRLLDLAPIGFKAMVKGKLPPIIPHKAEDNRKIKDLYERVEGEGK